MTNEENEVARITMEYTLYSTLNDYGIEVGEWKPTLWSAITNELFSRLERAGRVEKVGEEE